MFQYISLIAQAAPAGGSIVGLLMPFIIMIGIFYFIAIRPEQQRRKRHREMVVSLRKGEKVVTVGGIYGTIIEVRDDTVTLEIAKGTRVKLSKSSVGRKREDLAEEGETL